MGKIVFKDSSTSYKKNLQIVHTKEDIVINLPEPSGELISDLSIDRHIQNVEIGSDVSKILKPNILENNGGITSIENHIRPLDIASYRTSMFFVGKHTSTDWEAYADSEMRDLLDTGNSILNPDIKSSWLPTIEGDNRDVYVRYRFRSNSITSPWSDLLHYRTPSYGVRKFTITVSDNSLTPTITTSGFIPFGEDKIGKIEHRSTSWTIRDNKGRTVFESIDDTVNKTSIVVPDRKLFVSNNYVVNVIYNTNNIQYPSSNTITKRWNTIDVFIQKPELAYSCDNGEHYITASKFVMVNGSETHLTTSWKLVAYNPDTGTTEQLNIVRGTSNLTKINITPYILDPKYPHSITCIYHSRNYDSQPSSIKFNPKVTNILPIEFHVVEKPNKEIKFTYSKYEVKDERDSVKSIVFRVYDKNYDVERDNDLDMSNEGKYREDMEINIPLRKLISWYDGANTTFSSDREFVISTYVIGNKYNTLVYKDSYRPSIEISAVPVISGLDVSNVTCKITNFTTNASWVTVLKTQYVIHNPDGSVLHRGESIGNENTVYRLPSTVLLDPTITYTVKTTVVTNIGRVKLADKQLKVAAASIQTPEPSVTITPINDNAIKLTISGGDYVFTPSNKLGKEFKEAVYKIYKDTEVISIITRTTLDSFDQEFRKESKLTYSNTYRIGVVYKAMNGVESNEGIRNFIIGPRPSITIGKPELQLAMVNGNLEATITNEFSVSGLADSTHKATNWYLKKDTTIVKQSANDSINLKKWVVNKSELTDGTEYTVECSWQAADGSNGASTSKSINTFDYVSKTRKLEQAPGNTATIANAEYTPVTSVVVDNWLEQLRTDNLIELNFLHKQSKYVHSDYFYGGNSGQYYIKEGMPGFASSAISYSYGYNHGASKSHPQNINNVIQSSDNKKLRLRPSGTADAGYATQLGYFTTAFLYRSKVPGMKLFINGTELQENSLQYYALHSNAIGVSGSYYRDISKPLEPNEKLVIEFKKV